ncbi:MAG TPA: hypothetical protein EYP14_12325, partial [Planctomycetaceae bacterium]|nr:hypothetical protein [Planctomycetaceae bacterium]
AMEGFNAETVAWLAQHPSWDPRIRLAHPAQRAFLTQQILQTASQPLAGWPFARIDAHLVGRTPYDGLIGRTSQINGLCLASQGLAMDVAVMRALQDMGGLALAAADAAQKKKSDAKDDKDQKKEKKDEKKSKKEESLIDGMPESFIGPLLAELVAHEVGHTLGLRHNFKASSVYPLSEINSPKLKGKKPLAGSVMDYLPVNFNVESGEIQGDYTMLGIGPYDYWAIEYGYSFQIDLKPILERVAEPELQYATDEDTGGPDPLARRYDFSKYPLDYAKNQLRLVKHLRSQLLDRFVKKGQSWAKAREGYELTLNIQLRAVSMMAGWVGVAFVHRDKKGDKNARVPIQVVPAKMQRDALNFVIETTFSDEAYDLTPELLSHMTVDKWLDGDGWITAFSEEPTWPVHDRIMGIQASTLTMLMNPTTLRRVYDNEFRVP